MEHIINVYTDGATSGNGQENSYGGWAYMITDGKEFFSSYGGEVGTTNNRMELTAAIKGIETARDLYPEATLINIISDSAYLVNCYTQGWYKNWEQNGWINSSKKPVLNRDLWEILIPYFYSINYTFTKIKGHAGHECNELVDELAKRGAQEAKNK